MTMRPKNYLSFKRFCNSKVPISYGIDRASAICLVAIATAVIGPVGPVLAADNSSKNAHSPNSGPGNGSPSSAGPAATAGMSPVQVAFNLYQMKLYSQSADMYETIIRTATPEPRLYYYAALANSAGGRAARAKQLFAYICANFAAAQEASLAKTALGASKQTAASTAVAAAPEAKKIAVKPHVKGAVSFSEAEIAKEGANAIDQSMYPNCWFEASMSALAQLPKGQRLLSSMIHDGEGDKYIVRFPGDGVEYVVSQANAAEAGIANRALWASLLECAQIRKFPGNQGARSLSEKCCEPIAQGQI